MIKPYNEDLARAVAGALDQERRHRRRLRMGITVNVDLAAPTPADIVAFVRDRLAGAALDLLFVSCTNFRALKARQALADAFAVPVVTSNSDAVEAIRRYGTRSRLTSSTAARAASNSCSNDSISRQDFCS